MPIGKVNCKQCDREFWGITTRANFCSAACKQKDFRARKKQIKDSEK